MKRIEQLINFESNRTRFDYLAEAIKNDKLVVFFGAGLSLWKAYTQWDYPFVWTNTQIKTYLTRLKNYYSCHDPNDETTQKINEIEKYISIGEELRDKENYLEWGSMLDKTIIALNELYTHTTLPSFKYENFKDFCVAAFKSKKTPSFQMPYQIPAIYFLPYLSNLLLTTNVDSSFEIIREKTGRKDWQPQAILPEDRFEEESWDHPAHSILYIHGHINRPESLVMTSEEYSRMYPEKVDVNTLIGGARNVLSTVVEKYSMMFLGASLQNDTTVSILNYEVKGKEASRKRRKIYFLPLAEMAKDGNLVKPPRIKGCETLVFDQKMYHEIPLILLHLIRQTSNHDESCTWQAPKLFKESKPVSEETKEQIDFSLKSPSTIDTISLSEEDIYNSDGVIQYLFEHYSISNHEKGELGWSICSIFNSKFSLNGAKEKDDEAFTPLHNYPIGDTVYVLVANPKLAAEDEKRLKLDIEKWHKDSGFLDERKCDPPEDGVILPRVRIIIIKDENEKILSEKDIKQRLDEFDDLVDRAEKAKVSLSKQDKVTMRNWFLLKIMTPVVRDIFTRVQAAEKEIVKKAEVSEPFDNTEVVEKKLSLKNNPISNSSVADI